MNGSLCYERVRGIAGGLWMVRCWMGAAHDDGAIVAQGGVEQPAREVWVADVDLWGRPRVLIARWAASRAPALWFVAVPDSTGDRFAMNIVAFSSPMLPPGTIVSDDEFVDAPVESSEQVGAIKWWIAEAEVDQVFVSPRFRRRHVATALIYTASGFHQMHGWPGKLHSDGRRTDLGAKFLETYPHPHRVAKEIIPVPSMDPPQGHSTTPPALIQDSDPRHPRSDVRRRPGPRTSQHRPAARGDLG